MFGEQPIPAETLDTTLLLRTLVGVKKGDFSVRLPADWVGVNGKIADTLNEIIEMNEKMAQELERVSRVVGEEGKIGQRVSLRGGDGAWVGMIDSVNALIGDLVWPTNETARVIGAVASGDLSQRMALEVDGRPLQGEFLRTARTVNTMVDQLNAFASEVTRVAREVGTEGKLGGQATVPGVSGTWKDLTDNVNELAANLTGQVRAIAEVATAVAKGDLTRSINVEARGEVAELKDNINRMIANLRETTQKNTEQDWLKTNLARFTRLLQGQRDLFTVSRTILSELAPLVNAQHGAFYLMHASNSSQEGSRLRLLATYAYNERKHLGNEFRLGEGLVGQCALEKERILITEAPGDYIQIFSGLGQTAPLSIVVLPVLFEGQVSAVIELASVQRFSQIHLAFLDQLTESIGIVLNTIQSSMRTEGLLQQSQSLAEELQRQQDQLRQTNEQLEERARLLAEEKSEIERNNREIVQARLALEEKAEQLALSSKYKSEFLANMSHEVRTLLNSPLILAQQLAENPQGNLTEKQVQFARTIYAAGHDLMSLINDILDLSKIESGTVTVEVDEIPFTRLREDLAWSFSPLAEDKGLEFSIQLDPHLPKAIYTDASRLQQVLKNLLANAIKFTDKGKVALHIAPTTHGWNADNDVLNQSPRVVAFSVTDTGIGIPPERHKIVFEAFQQADSAIAHKYGGTGLGLAISREIAALLGGELRLVSSAPGQGSTFTLFLPQVYVASTRRLPPTHSEPAPETGAISPTGPKTAIGAAEEAVAPIATVEMGDRPLLQDALQAALTEAAPRPTRRLLVVQADAARRQSVVDLMSGDDVHITAVASGAEALAALQAQRPGDRERAPYDGIILDLKLPDMSAFRLLEEMREEPGLHDVPIIVYTGRGFTRSEEARLRKAAQTWLIKPAHSPEQLLDEAASFLRQAAADPSELRQSALAHMAEGLASQSEASGLAGKKVLIVDDDIRNVFALTSMLERHQAVALPAESGPEALEILNSTPDVDLVLMDIMLPEMDGYEAMRAIRRMPGLKNLPVIALTAKAMKGDREKCLEAGASDYVAKPVHADQLMTLLRLWLHRRQPAD